MNDLQATPSNLPQHSSANAPETAEVTAFLTFLESLSDMPQTEDLQAWVLPLFEQVAALHARGMVAPLEGVQRINFSHGQLWFEESSALKPRRAEFKLAKVDREGTLEVSRRLFADELGSHDLSVGSVQDDSGNDTARLTAPVFLPGYVSWEHVCGHHDPLTDIFVLGLLLASLACRINLSDEDSLQRFVANRNNLFALNPRINPVWARLIGRMTELSRSRREPDLQEVIQTLRNYRLLESSLEAELPVPPGGSMQQRSQVLQTHLRDRLFELSRRNRLLYFRPSQQTLNLTVGSFPLLLDVKNIRPEQLFYWHDDIARQIVGESPIQLQKYLRFEDQPFLPAQLDAIRTTAQRDQAEYGFSQLRLVLCMFRWHNFKEDKNEAITTPLLLMPVSLTRKKGVRDTYTLQAESSIAEVNPALRHVLRQVYGMELPEQIDLSNASLDEFHAQLEMQIRASEPGITLHKIDKPQIQLIRQQAKLKLDQYERRRKKQQLSGLSRRSYGDFEYSYDPANYHPLGVQLYHDRVRPQRAPLSNLLGKPHARPAFMVPNEDQVAPQMGTAPQAIESEQTIEKDTYVLEENRQRSPYDWEFDLCALTLGNFNYRKMSLVRDYNAVIRDSLDSPSFSRIFSLEPRKIFGENDATPDLKEQFTVVPQDPTQGRAIGHARSGESMIIQGPPGTGKSQTITNLIADYVARGKRVMFVCEKRAAIDVVYHRLQQQGLGRLCALIHDSQADKKAFVKDLKSCYEGWLQPVDDPQRHESKRNELIQTIVQDMTILGQYSDRMQTVYPALNVSLHRLYLRIAELNAIATDSVSLSAEQQEALPDYADWSQHAQTYLKLVERLRESGGNPVLAAHPVRFLHPDILANTQPTQAARSAVADTLPLLEQLQEKLTGLPPTLHKSLGDIEALGRYLHGIEPVLQRNMPELLDPQHARSKALNTLLKRYRKQSDSLAEARKKASNWHIKPASEEVDIALDTALQVERNWYAFLTPAWWPLRKLMSTHYDMSKHAVKPRWSACLSALKQEYSCTEALLGTQGTLETDWQIHDQEEFTAQINSLHAQSESLPMNLLALQQDLVGKNFANPAGLLDTLRLINLAERALQRSLQGYQHLTLTELIALLRAMDEDFGWLPILAPGLATLATAPAPFCHAAREWPGSPESLELAIARNSLQRLYRDDVAFSKQTGEQLDQVCQRLGQHFRVLLAENAQVILERCRNQFLQHLALSNQTAAQLTAEQKEFKKRYNSGRREVENEFAKVMRFKAIRELASADSGLVVRDLKPVWLMSPLSISDTLPLESNYFDVVIFDEASQIPVEEAVPPLYRGPQVIVVGDEMQLPPTNFFSSKTENDGEDEELLADLESDSFLTQAAKNLPSTMLEWHYRSRSEALISFSNHRFYDGRLLTIPDHRLLQTADPIVVNASDAATGALPMALSRPISFHHLPTGVYEDRRNAAEAAYIAALVRELLGSGSSHSIGIVAFSEAQQTEIDQALRDLAEQDKTFAMLLDAAFEREEDNQFCGLFVKNLENVQGDERDLIILSVCYGYDKQKKILMNFGPINKAGGEKRLNVVFSRAKQHMFVVSSIKHHDIKNDYNPGAFALKAYLQYAEQSSIGNGPAMQQVIQLLGGKQKSSKEQIDLNPVVRQLGEHFTQKGYIVDYNIGQSNLRCDLGIRTTADTSYCLGILVDTNQYYETTDILERDLQQPALLQNSGWLIERVLSKDWAERPADVLARLNQRLLS